MYSRLFLIVILAILSVGLSFTGFNFVNPTRSVVPSKIYMGGASGFKTTREGKAAVVEEVKDLLDKSTMIFGVNVSGMTPKDLMLLRRSLPEGSKFMTVKNRLLKKAAEGSEWAAIEDAAVNQNGYFFIEDDLQGTVKAWQNYVKEKAIKEEKVAGGVLEGGFLDAKGVGAVAKMPSKIELITRIGVGIRAVPTKIGKGIRLVPTKIGKGVKLAFDVEDVETD